MPQPPETWQYQRTIPSTPAASRELLDEVLSHLDASGWPDRDVFGVHLALEEALANAIKHGNKEDPSKQIHVRGFFSPTALRLEVTDEGTGFNPASVPDPTDPRNLGSPRGRGIHLIRSFMSRVEYKPPGNCVVMEKYREETSKGESAAKV